MVLVKGMEKRGSIKRAEKQTYFHIRAMVIIVCTGIGSVCCIGDVKERVVKRHP